MQKYPNVVATFRHWRGITTRHYKNLIEAVEEIGYARCMSLTHNRIYGQFVIGVEWGPYDEFIIRDDHGSVIHMDIVKSVAENHAPPNHWQRAWDRRKKYVFRRGPVEGIHRGRFHRGSICRRPVVAQQTRENDFLQYDEDCIEHNINVRAKRNQTAIPQWWDDDCKASLRDNNWKKYRKQQWK